MAQSIAWIWTVLLFLLHKKTDKSVMVKWKLHLGQKQLHYGGNTTLALCTESMLILS